MKRTFLAAAIGQILIDRQTKNVEGEAEMTRMFMMDEAQHAQIVEALESCSMDCDAVGADGGMSFDEDRVSTALAMLKAMQPLSPVAWEHHFDDNSKRLSYCNDVAGFPPRADAVEVKPLYTPTKD